MRAALAVLLLVLPLAGCAGPPPAGGGGDEGPHIAVERPTDDLWTGAVRQTLVNVTTAASQELDALCAMRGAMPLNRTPDGRVLLGAGFLEVRVHVDPTLTGLQVGWAVDGGARHWLPAVTNGDAVQRIDVQPDQVESAQRDLPPRWSFYDQLSAPSPADPSCGPGGGTGSWSVLIEAVKGNATSL